MFQTFDSSEYSGIGRRSTLGFALALLLSPTCLLAQDWQFEPRVRMSAEYNDNVRLLPDDDDAIESSSVSLDATGGMVRRTETTTVRFSPRVRLRSYFENDIDDIDDYFADFLVRHNLQTGSVGLQARYSQESVLRAEIENPDFDDPDVIDPLDLDTGRIRVEDTRDRGNITAFLERDVTQRNGFRIGASYLDVSYDGTSGLRDYSTYGARGEWLFKASERSTWALGAYGGEFESENDTVTNESSIVGGDIGYRYALGERTDLRISAGVESVDTDSTTGNVTTSTKDDLSVFSIMWIRTGENSRLVANVSRAVDPGGFGALQERTQFRVRYDTALSPRLDARVDARVQSTEASGRQNAVDRDFQRIRLSLVWHLSRSWALEPAYTFTSQDFSDENNDATANSVSLAFVYDPTRNR